MKPLDQASQHRNVSSSMVCTSTNRNNCEDFMVCVEIQINNILLTNALILDHLSGSTWLVDGFGASKFVTRYAIHITSNFIHC